MHGGLSVGLGIESIVSYSFEKKLKMLISVFRVSRETFIIYGGKSTADVAMGFSYAVKSVFRCINSLSTLKL